MSESMRKMQHIMHQCECALVYSRNVYIMAAYLTFSFAVFILIHT